MCYRITWRYFLTLKTVHYNVSDTKTQSTDYNSFYSYLKYDVYEISKFILNVIILSTAICVKSTLVG